MVGLYIYALIDCMRLIERWIQRLTELQTVR